MVILLSTLMKQFQELEAQDGGDGQVHRTFDWRKGEALKGSSGQMIEGLPHIYIGP